MVSLELLLAAGSVRSLLRTHRTSGVFFLFFSALLHLSSLDRSAYKQSQFSPLFRRGKTWAIAFRRFFLNSAILLNSVCFPWKM